MVTSCVAHSSLDWSTTLLTPFRRPWSWLQCPTVTQIKCPLFIVGWWFWGRRWRRRMTVSPKIWRRLSLTSSFPESEDMIIPKVVPVARSTIHWLQLLPLLMFPLLPWWSGEPHPYYHHHQRIQLLPLLFPLLPPTLFFPPKVTNRTYLGRQKRYKPPPHFYDVSGSFHPCFCVLNIDYNPPPSPADIYFSCVTVFLASKCSIFFVFSWKWTKGGERDEDFSDIIASFWCCRIK